MKNCVALGFVFAFVSILSRPLLAADTGQTTVFNVGQTVLPVGEGEIILQTFEPSLAGHGLGAQIESELNPQIGSLAQTLEARVLTQLNELNFVPFVKKMADAGGMVARAMPVDNATKFQVFSLTGAALASASTTLIQQASDIEQSFDNISNGQSPNIGASADVSVMLGINLAAFDLQHSAFFNPDRMQLFVSAMRLPLGNIASDKFSVDIWHIGVHGKYLLLNSKQLSRHYDFVRWGGLALTTGFSYASQNVEIRADLPGDTEASDYTLPGANKTLTVNYSYAGTGVVSTHSDTYTIPIEVSSSLQLLYFLTLYAGGAVDFTWGNTSMGATASEPVDVSLTDGTTSLSILNPTPNLALNVVQSPTAVSGRAFLGLQINAGVAALFAQGTIDSTNTAGAAAGLRFFY